MCAKSFTFRVGNAAYDQKQLDVYGELLLSASELVTAGVSLTDTEWTQLRRVVEHVCAVWDQPDYGIWEVRSNPEQFVHSKVMCWAAVDRGIELAATRGDPVPDHWRRTRDTIHETVCEEGFREAENAFVRSFEADQALDAACLRIPLVGFLPADAPRVQGTIDAVFDRLIGCVAVERQQHDAVGLMHHVIAQSGPSPRTGCRG